MNRAILTGLHQNDVNFKATELRLGLPGSDECDQDMTTVVAKNNKRASPELNEDSGPNGVNSSAKSSEPELPPAPKAQIVGWPPVRSYRKNNIQAKNPEPEGGIYVKVSMDGAPYLRKIDVIVYNGYSQLLEALETIFKFSIDEYSEREAYKGSEYGPAYEDKDGDLMLAGDVPWEMFKSSCKRVRIMRGVQGKGLGCGV